MPKIVVIRHSIAIANEQKVIAGATLDSPLSEAGRALAVQKGKRLAVESFRPAAIFSSPMQRTIQTAQIILDELSLDLPVQPLPGLNERSFGDYEGTSYEETIAAFDRYGDNPPSVEPVEVVIRRIIQTFEDIKRETTGTTLIVTHSAPVMILQAYLFRPDMLSHYWHIGDPANCEGLTHSF
ncbi:histidine phosphatase family protein [Candidatus Saccharibacteria bacterium]|nr:histidine phosphatase family protein [Candidatus Saccharibacteria bacterium]